MRRAFASMLVAPLLVLVGACGGEERDPSPRASTSARLSSTAKLTIEEPAAGATIRGSQVRVRITLEGGVIVEQVSSNLKPNEGHIHLLLDGNVVQLLGSLDETIEDVAPGAHLLQVEFVAADHGPFSPRVISAVNFTAA